MLLAPRAATTPEVSPFLLGWLLLVDFIQQVLLPWLNDHAEHIPIGSS
jgi:hypothetical protein